MEIKKLSLYTQSLNKQFDFYKNVLGFKVIDRSEKSFTIKTQENQITFIASEKTAYYHFAFLIPTGALEAAISWLKEKQITTLPYLGNDIIQFESGRAVYFYDKHGNIVEFIERPLTNYPESSSFSIEDVIKVNEIGRPSKKVLDTATKLVSQYGIIPINKDRFDDTFCWVGDHHGVILITKEGRNWLPTQKPGITNDFSIVYEVKGIEYKLLFQEDDIIELN